jgi:hypothetical protein
MEVTSRKFMNIEAHQTRMHAGASGEDRKAFEARFWVGTVACAMFADKGSRQLNFLWSIHQSERVYPLSHRLRWSGSDLDEMR